MDNSTKVKVKGLTTAARARAREVIADLAKRNLLEKVDRTLLEDLVDVADLHPAPASLDILDSWTEDDEKLTHSNFRG